jgi:hypothetical protein
MTISSISSEHAVASDASRRGRAVLRAYLTVQEARDGPAKAVFDATRRAGSTTDLAMRLRRHGELPYPAVTDFAGLVGMPESDLRMWALNALERCDVIELTRDQHGHPVAIEERVGVAAPVLAQCEALWRIFEPKEEERCALEAADLLAFTPMALSDLRGALEAAGFAPARHRKALEALKGVGLLRRIRSESLNEDVLFSPYVWGTEAVATVEFLKRLPVNERDALSRLARTAAERPGTPTEGLAEEKLLAAARHTGLIDTVPVATRGSAKQRGFAFPPSLETGVSQQLTESLHERKLFVAHILNGHYFAPPHYGRINDPVVLVNALIKKGEVGPATSVDRDYLLLQAKGIVTTEDIGNGRAMLKLIKRDVAEESLELIKLALGEHKDDGANSVDALWLPGTNYITPERDRSRLGAPEGEELDIISSTVQELKRDIARELRAEDL